MEMAFDLEANFMYLFERNGYFWMKENYIKLSKRFEIVKPILPAFPSSYIVKYGKDVFTYII